MAKVEDKKVLSPTDKLKLRTIKETTAGVYLGANNADRILFKGKEYRLRSMSADELDKLMQLGCKFVTKQKK